MLVKPLVNAGTVLLGVGVIALVTRGVIAHPALLIAVAATVAMPLIVNSAATRFSIVLVGALLVFQSDASNLKLGYLVVAMLCVAVSLGALARSGDAVIQAFKPMLTWSVPTLLMLLSSYLNASTLGTSFDPWMRDVLPYLLLVALPVIGLDAGRSASRRALEVTLLAVTVLAAVGFAVTWLARRGAIEQSEQFLLASATLPLLGFSYALVKTGARGQSRRLLWAFAAALIAACLISTGTRTNLVILAAASLGTLGSIHKGRIPLLRLLSIGTITTASTAAVIGLGATVLRIDPEFFRGRYEALTRSLSGGLATDQSFLIRAASYAEAKGRWELHPWFGGGPGYIFRTLDSFTLDTPWVVPAKFGLIGTVIIVAFLASLAVSIRRCQRAPAPVFTAARSWGFALLVLIFFGPWVEDKGTALAVTLLVALVAQQAQTSADADGGTVAARPSPETGMANNQISTTVRLRK